jgi:hypothetical protein
MPHSVKGDTTQGQAMVNRPPPYFSSPVDFVKGLPEGSPEANLVAKTKERHLLSRVPAVRK